MPTIDQVKLTSVKNMGNDKLLIEGTIEGIVDITKQNDKEGKETEVITPRSLQAEGWMSAMSNHFGPSQYDGDGHLSEDAQPRQMSKEEKQEYCKKLLLEQNPVEEVAEPKELDII